MKKFIHSFLRKIQAATAGLALAAAVLSPAAASATSPALQSLPTLSSCSWNRPGVNPFMGDVVAAVDRYADIPADVRARLKQRMAKRDYDDLVSIRRDKIVGDHGHQYGSTIRDMHFGDGQICHTVSRDAWTTSMQERGLVYCESGHCILVPTVCRNVSRIADRGVAPERAEAAGETYIPVPPIGAVPAVAAAPSEVGAGPIGTGPALGIDSGASFGVASTANAVGPLAAAAGVSAGGGGGAVAAVSTGTPVATTADTSLPAPITAAVPEPSTWVSMIGGLIGLGIACRSRAKRRETASNSAL